MPFELSTDGWVGAMAFDPAATHLAVVVNGEQSSTLLTVDAERGSIVTRRQLEAGFRPLRIAYGASSEQLLIYGQPLGPAPGLSRPDPPRVVLLDAGTLEVQWEQPLAEVLNGYWCEEGCQGPYEQMRFASWTPVVVISADARKVHVLHADDDRLTTVDADDRSVRTIALGKRESWIERVLSQLASVAKAKEAGSGAFKSAVLSSDGTRMYVVGGTTDAEIVPVNEWRITHRSLGLRMLDVERGEEIAAEDVDVSRDAEVSLTPDGLRLLVVQREDPRTHIFDEQSLAPVAHLEGWEVVPARTMDGEFVTLGKRSTPASTHLALFDPRSFEILRSWSVHPYASWHAWP
ncbi:MAG: hypothetical protein GEU73_05655 [Chloroflexi bacterium]|nr:hypothetical protein [Chloroflexota bacterium]